jgi:hypothetical protein
VKESLDKAKAKAAAPKHVDQVPSSMFFTYNTQLGPPYNVLVDTNFINFSIKVVEWLHVVAYFGGPPVGPFCVFSYGVRASHGPGRAMP